MAEYELSNKADDDFNEIYTFSRQRVGKAKADAYLLALEERFSILARQPRLGAGSITSGRATCVTST